MDLLVGPLRGDSSVTVADIVAAFRFLDVRTPGRQDLSHARQLQRLFALAADVECRVDQRRTTDNHLRVRQQNSLSLLPRSLGNHRSC